MGIMFKSASILFQFVERIPIRVVHGQDEKFVKGEIYDSMNDDLLGAPNFVTHRNNAIYLLMKRAIALSFLEKAIEEVDDII